MNTSTTPYNIGTPGTPWSAAERLEWLLQQHKQRSYQTDVLSVIEKLRSAFDIEQYGQVTYGDEAYPLFAIRTKDWQPTLPVILVTGGVHGYETSGVHGALKFAEEYAADYQGLVNILIVPCVSPWGYERIHRWNADAIDPNRSFRPNSPSGEAAALWQLVVPLLDSVVMHIDLHETTDTDETEFRPALSARDGTFSEPHIIPDGFYLVDDTENPQPEFQQAIITAVEQVTHIAPADEKGEIIGSPLISRGVIQYPLSQLGLCAGITNATFKTTTEVYPDSPNATPEQCNVAQVEAVRAAITFVLNQKY